MRRRLAVTGAAVLAALATACSGPGAPAGTLPGPAAGTTGLEAGRLDADGVTVVLRWQGASPTPRLVATYTPLAAGYHLYGTQLPPLGVDGVGRPTRLEVGGTATALAAPVPDRPARPEPVAGASRPVPVFPAGPVTLTLATRIDAAGPPRVWVSYAACSATACMPPVTHQQVVVAPPT